MEKKAFNNNDIRKAIHRSQHTQRNWDLSKQIPQEDVDTLIESVTQCPSKQGRPYYKVHAITNRDIIEKIHAKTEGFGLVFEGTTVKSQTNPQTLANMVLVFEQNTDIGAAHHPAYKNTFDTVQRDTDMAVGIAAGYLNIVANMMGYRTGCCLCYQPNELQDTLGLEGKPLLIMGVGYANEDMSRRIHHLDPEYKFSSKRKEEIQVKFLS